MANEQQPADPFRVTPGQQTALQRFLTGERVLVGSTNVLAMTYAAPASRLYVEYKPHPRKTARRRRKRPAVNYSGPYHYENVSPTEAEHFWKSGSKGKWVWSHLRIRGTALGHKKRYGKSALPKTQARKNLEKLASGAKSFGALFLQLIATIFS